jgi:aspartate racemase
LKTIGILGGMSAASTQTYYRELCRLTAAELGGLHSPQLLIRSVDFADIEALQAAGAWDEAGQCLQREAQALERGGAELLVLATNTMHKVAEAMMTGVSIPLVHIADATAERIVGAGLRAPGLMATAFTMEESFYTDRLSSAGLSVIIPDAADRAQTHCIIYDELCRNVISEASRGAFVAIAHRLIERGADCLILGCTEVGMLLDQTNVAVPVFDTTLVHCQVALEQALAGVPRAGGVPYR